MTFHTFIAKRVNMLSGPAFSNGYDLHNFTGDQTKLSLYSDIVEGPKTVMHRRIQTRLDRADIESIVEYLLRMPIWRERIWVMAEAANKAMKVDKVTEAVFRAAVQDALDELDFGHTVCRAYGCHHKGHPERDPKNNVRDN